MSEFSPTLLQTTRHGTVLAPISLRIASQPATTYWLQHIGEHSKLKENQHTAGTWN
jgi:hypothetical protein